jgi:CDP-diacylglycerol--glycerol-3-phosphate 3-phosphatidyltransferase
MPTIYSLKPRFQQSLRPLVRILHRGGATANMVTLAAVVASILYGAWMAIEPGRKQPLLLLPVFMFIRMALNAIDGMLAREFNQQSKAGAILNEMGDVVSDAALFMPFALLPGVRPEIVLAVVFLSVLSEFAGVMGQVVGNSRRYDGPLGKSDRAALFGTVGLVLGLGWPVAAWIDPVLVLAAILLCATIWNRARHAIGT